MQSLGWERHWVDCPQGSEIERSINVCCVVVIVYCLRCVVIVMAVCYIVCCCVREVEVFAVAPTAWEKPCCFVFIAVDCCYVLLYCCMCMFMCCMSLVVWFVGCFVVCLLLLDVFVVLLYAYCCLMCLLFCCMFLVAWFVCCLTAWEKPVADHARGKDVRERRVPELITIMIRQIIMLRMISNKITNNMCINNNTNNNNNYD